MYHSLSLSEGGGIAEKTRFIPQAGNAGVLIGIGGTGLDVLRKIKRELEQQLGADNPDEAIPGYEGIKFLGIDTDPADLCKEAEIAGGLKPEERFSLYVPALGELLADPESGLQESRYIWMSLGLPLQYEDGAGGVRQAGRFCLFQKADALRDRICSLVQSARICAGAFAVRVHIFAGISGGTGSGCFADICYLVRDILDDIDSLSGYFFLPDIQLNRPGIAGNRTMTDCTQKNGYAALRELDYLMSLKYAGEFFEQDYGNFRIRTQKPPVDTCCLISAVGAGGVPIEDAYNHALSVTAGYVLCCLADLTDYSASRPYNGKKRSLPECLFGIDRALRKIYPSCGKECAYRILGFSSAELPLTHIGTYLASETFLKMRPSLRRPSDDALCAQYAEHLGLSVEGMRQLLGKGLNPVPDFWEDSMDLPQHLNETGNDGSAADPSVTDPLKTYREDCFRRIRANQEAQTKPLHQYDPEEASRIRDGSFAARLFFSLLKAALSPEQGPCAAADLLRSDSCRDLGDVLDELLTELTAEQRSCQERQDLCLRTALQAAHEYNLEPVKDKRKLHAYLEACTAWLQNVIETELCRAAVSMTASFRQTLSDTNDLFFSPLRDMLSELDRTFRADALYLKDPASLTGTKWNWRIFELDDVRPSLDEAVLGQLDPAAEHRRFVRYLLDHWNEWKDRNDGRIGSCVNQYMKQRFDRILSRTMDQLLMVRYDTQDPEDLTSRVGDDILRRICSNAAPLLWWKDPFPMDPTAIVSRDILLYPGNSACVAAAADHRAIDDHTENPCPSRIGDRITCLSVTAGVPLHAFEVLYDMKEAYDRTYDRGTHLHEADIDWRETLPTPIPYSRRPHETCHGAEIAALYDEAKEKHVIDIRAPRDSRTYVVRELPDTDGLVNGYVKSDYFCGGAFRREKLRQDIRELEEKRAALFPPDTTDLGYPVLLNDRRIVPDSLDARPWVRKDNFIRYGRLQETARASLAELKKVDDKLARMRGWMDSAVDEADVRDRLVRRFLHLYVLGYFGQSPDGIRLLFPDQGRNGDLLLAGPGMRFGQEQTLWYQAYVTLNEKEKDAHCKAAIRSLEQKADEAFVCVQESFFGPIRELEKACYGDAALKSIRRSLASFTKSEKEDILAFYRMLGSRAHDLAETAPAPKPADVRWQCPGCGFMLDPRRSICPACGTSRPTKMRYTNPYSETDSESGFCPVCGEALPAGARFCPVCGSPV